MADNTAYLIQQKIVYGVKETFVNWKRKERKVIKMMEQH